MTSHPQQLLETAPEPQPQPAAAPAPAPAAAAAAAAVPAAAIAQTAAVPAAPAAAPAVGPPAPAAGAHHYRPGLLDILKRKMREAAGLGPQQNNPFGPMPGFSPYPPLPQMMFPPLDPFQQQQQQQQLLQQQQQQQLQAMMGMAPTPAAYNPVAYQQAVQQQQSMLQPGTPFLPYQQPAMPMLNAVQAAQLQQPLSMYNIPVPPTQPMMISPNPYEAHLTNYLQAGLDPYSPYTPPQTPYSPYTPYPQYATAAPVYPLGNAPVPLYDSRYGARWFPERNFLSSVKDLWQGGYM